MVKVPPAERRQFVSLISRGAAQLGWSAASSARHYPSAAGGASLGVFVRFFVQIKQEGVDCFGSRASKRTSHGAFLLFLEECVFDSFSLNGINHRNRQMC